MINRTNILLLIFVTLLPLGSLHAAFFISGKENCGYGDYSYQIGSDVLFADLSIQSGPDVLFADITIQIVDSPQEADLIFVDHSMLNYESINALDMTICKTSLFADKSIQIGPNVLFADISVQVGKDVIFPDYRLFFSSDSFSVNEAAGLFPAIWRFNEKN